MKKVLRVLGVILVVCGLGIYLISGSAQKDMAPNEVKVGYMSDGKFVETDSGYMGGNKEGQESMESLKGFGTLAIIGGVAALIASFVIRDDNQYYN